MTEHVSTSGDVVLCLQTRLVAKQDSFLCRRGWCADVCLSQLNICPNLSGKVLSQSIRYMKMHKQAFTAIRV